MPVRAGGGPGDKVGTGEESGGIRRARWTDRSTEEDKSLAMIATVLPMVCRCHGVTVP